MRMRTECRIGMVAAVAFLLTTTTIVAWADDAAWDLDANLHFKNPPKTKGFVEGDSIDVTYSEVDLFGAPAGTNPTTDENTPLFPPFRTGAAVGATAVPMLVPESAEGLYFVAAHDFKLYEGQCPGVVPDPNAKFECAPPPDRLGDASNWHQDDNNMTVSRCVPAQNHSLAVMRTLPVNPLSIVHYYDPSVAVANCRQWTIAPSSLEYVRLSGRVAGKPASVVELKKDPNTLEWNGQLPLTAGTWSLQVLARKVGETERATTPISISVESVDEHSRVRIQAEVFTTNRLRTVNLGATISPIFCDSFFKFGPWSKGVCGLVPIATIRLSGDTSTVVQVGAGIGIFFTQSMQLNFGMFAGTSSVSTWWDPARNWFIGFAIDPILLSEMSKATKQ